MQHAADGRVRLYVMVYVPFKQCASYAATTAGRSIYYSQCTVCVGVWALAIGSDSLGWSLCPEKW
jgi:hypothetical protein